ncbi:MAG: hypothetical protein KC592_18400 [Nitrospira sp.]|nr:hypothetical protein [Nitrospira sp.]MCW5781726.1 hypothetical protein [Nitrospirales bacterium]
MSDIPPNFGVQKFATQEEAIEYLKNLGFRKTLERSDYDVYETEQEPKKRATIYQEKDGKYFVGQHVEKK